MEQKTENNKRIDDLTRKLTLPPKRTERPVPTVYRHTIKVEWYRRFTLLDRLKIMIGYNFLVVAGVACQHNPGVVQPLVVGDVSRHLKPEDHMANVVSQMLEEKKSAAEVCHEPAKKGDGNGK